MVVILLQDGKGGDIVSTMGGGGSQTVFGSTGATNFLTKGTITLTIIFVLTSLSLAILKTREKRSILDTVKPETTTEAPAAAVSPTDKKENTEKEAVKDAEKGNVDGVVKDEKSEAETKVNSEANSNKIKEKDAEKDVPAEGKKK
jgi:preprotein translocase subunit SecG